MEASCCYCPTKSHNFRRFTFPRKPKFSSVPSYPLIRPQQLTFWRPGRRLSNRGSLTAARGCGNSGGPPVREVEICCRELEEEEEMKDRVSGEEDGIGGRWREKCEGEGEGQGQGQGGGGIAELMECLEREAIMGEDQGKEPSDYNRRALIFDKSSRVFQALKEKLDAQKS